MFISIVTAYLILWPIALHMTARCAVFDRSRHSRITLAPAFLKRAGV
jgi:hypothetical protein